MNASEWVSERRASALAAVPPAPRKPSKRARALIFAYTGMQKAFLLMGSIFFAFGALLSTPFVWGVPVDLAIALASRTAQGTIVDTHVNESAKIGGRHPRKVTFTYVIDGQEHTGTSSTLDEQIVEAATPGASYDVEVSRLNPAWARLAGTTYSTFGYPVLFVLIFPGIGLTFLILAVRSNRREIRAFRHGTPIMARVVYRGPDRSTRINGRHPHMVSWEFKVDDEIYEGKFTTMSVLAMEELGAAGEIPILYLPQNPRINTIFIP